MVQKIVDTAALSMVALETELYEHFDNRCVMLMIFKEISTWQGASPKQLIEQTMCTRTFIESIRRSACTRSGSRRRIRSTLNSIVTAPLRKASILRSCRRWKKGGCPKAMQNRMHPNDQTSVRNRDTFSRVNYIQYIPVHTRM